MLRLSEQPEREYWKDPQVVGDFASLPVQGYWRDYFADIIGKGKKALDLGCGGGRYTEMLTSMGFDVVAADLSEEMLSVTRKRVDSLSGMNPLVVQANMSKLPFESEWFDVVLTNGVLHNAENCCTFERAVSEISRVVARDGKVCLNVFFDDGQNTNVERVSERVFKTADELPMTLYEKDDLLKVLGEAGIVPEGEIKTYHRDMDVGKRSVMRGVFEKLS
jgi:ubiquinone/menaquinone biosynthesis C-methylase UbiE